MRFSRFAFSFILFGSSFQQAFAASINLMGDSTVASYSSGSKQGWGKFLASFLKNTTVNNFASGGKSTKTYYQDDIYDRALRKKANFMFIQFGHNDSHKGYREYTNPKTDFRTYLRRMIEESRSKGFKPVLVTPPHRNRFKGSQVVNDLQDYADAIKIIAKEQKIAVIDLYKRTEKEFEKMGKSKTSKLFVDTSHFTSSGAKVIAGWVADEVSKTIPSLPKK